MKPRAVDTALLFLGLVLIAVSQAYANVASSEDFMLETAAIGFQHNAAQYVYLEATVGVFNSSATMLTVNGEGGSFQFVNEDPCAFTVTFTVAEVSVNGNPVASGSGVNAPEGESTVVTWNLLPQIASPTVGFAIISLAFALSCLAIALKREKTRQNMG